jgi:hypothetical protein
LKERYWGRKDEEEEVSSYCMALGKSENTGTRKWEHQIALCAEFVSEKVINCTCSQTDCAIKEILVYVVYLLVRIINYTRCWVHALTL